MRVENWEKKLSDYIEKHRNKKFDIEISKYFRSYEYIKKIVNFSQKRKGQPYNLYFNFLTDDEIEYLIYEIIDQYKLILLL